MKWEYSDSLVDADSFDNKLKKQLNVAGAAEWELVQIITLPDGSYRAIFKRPDTMG